MPPPMLSTCMNPACVQRAPGQNMLCPLESSFLTAISFCLCSLYTIASSAVAPSPTAALSYHPSPGSPNSSFQSLLASASIPLVPPQLFQHLNPSCFQDPSPSSNLTPTSIQTTPHPHHSARLPALPSTLTRSFAAPKTPIPSFSPHCSLSNN